MNTRSERTRLDIANNTQSTAKNSKRYSFIRVSSFRSVPYLARRFQFHKAALKRAFWAVRRSRPLHARRLQLTPQPQKPSTTLTRLLTTSRLLLMAHRLGTVRRITDAAADATAESVAAEVNANTGLHGVTATAKTFAYLDFGTASHAHEITINGTTTDLLLSATASAMVNAININSAATGITATETHQTSFVQHTGGR